MARPQLDVGTAGKIGTTRQMKDDSGRWVAAPKGRLSAKAEVRWYGYAKVRITAETITRVQKYGTTQAAVIEAVQKAVDKLLHPGLSGTGDITPHASVQVVAEAWLDGVMRRVNLPIGDRHRLAASTAAQYVGNAKRYLTGSEIAGMTIEKANRAPVVKAYLQGIVDEHGAGAAITARTVLSSVFTFAVEHEAATFNMAKGAPVPAPKVVSPKGRDHRRAFTEDERSRLVEYVDADAYAQVTDVADLIVFMLGTGLRVSEALAVKWGDIDLATGRVVARGTKTKGAEAVLPTAMSATLRARLAKRERVSDYLFPVLGRQPKGEARSTSRGTVRSHGLRQARPTRDTSNTLKQIRKVLDAAGFEWATSHSFRRTNITETAKIYGVVVAATQARHSTTATTQRAYIDVVNRATGTLLASAI